MEEKLPRTIKLFREFYFSLPEIERDRLEKREDRTATPEYINLVNQLIKEFEQEMKEGRPLVPNKGKRKHCNECGLIINRTANYCEHCGVKQPEIPSQDISSTTFI